MPTWRTPTRSSGSNGNAAKPDTGLRSWSRQSQVRGLSAAKSSGEERMPSIDENMKLLDDARERLLKQHGGYDGLWDYLLRDDQLRQRREKTRKRKTAAKRRRRKS